MSAARKSRDTRPSIGIVHDEGPLAARIEDALESSGYSVAFAVTLDELKKNHRDIGSEIIVVTGDPRSPNPFGFKRLRELFPEVLLVACIAPVYVRGLRWAIDVGVDGIVWDSELEQTLDPTIRAVCAGQLVVPRDSYRRSGSEEITNREKQTLSLVIMGLTNREIAQKLFISESTVKSHLNTAYRKLGVHSRAEAARLIADPAEGLGTGILAITGPGLARGLAREK